MIRSGALMREMIRKHARFFLGITLVGLAFRLFLVFRAPGVVDDSRLYADIAKNWLQHGIYGITNSGTIMPTLSRLPGYPAFLAAIFRLFGSDNFRAVLLAQVPFDLATCFLMADMARRLFSERAAKAAFLLAAVCPFLANYAAAALTETLEIFFTALAFDLAFRGLKIGEASAGSGMAWLGCGLAIGGAILLRPDGGILLASIGGYLLWLLLKSLRRATDSTKRRFTPSGIILAGVLVATGALAPLIPWTVRNLHTLHRFHRHLFCRHDRGAGPRRVGKRCRLCLQRRSVRRRARLHKPWRRGPSRCEAITTCSFDNSMSFLAQLQQAGTPYRLCPHRRRARS